MFALGVAVVGLVMAVVMVWGAYQASREPVSRQRLERFATRQRLVVTADNGPLLLHALRLTRQWRSVGLWTGLACGLLWALREGQLTLNFTAAFLGWFVGAVVAEWRIAGLPATAGRRAASLDRRTLWRYLRTAAAVLLGLAVLVLTAAAVAVLVAAGADHRDVTTRALAWLAAAAVGLALILGTLRRVVSRPQPPAAPDLLAADDALRGRAATVLAGSTIAAAGLCTSQLFHLMSRLVTSDQEQWVALGVGVMLLETVVGYLVAVTASPVRRRRVEAVRVAA